MVGFVRKFRLAAAVAVLGAAGCDSPAPTEVPGPSFASSSGATTITVPFAAADVNPCTGEAFAVEGHQTVVAQLVVKDGATKFHLHVTTAGQGTGASGSTYTLSDILNVRDFFQDVGPFQFQIVQNVKIVSGSSSDNFTLRARTLVVFNGSEFVVAMDSFEFSCR